MLFVRVCCAGSEFVIRTSCDTLALTLVAFSRASQTKIRRGCAAGTVEIRVSLN